MIRVGIVGANHGQRVLVPAFRLDPRCQVTALAATDAGRAAALAESLGIERAFGDWRSLVEDADVDLVAIATPPALQPQIALRCLELGKPVFAEKPMAADLAGAAAMVRAADATGVATMMDFNFIEIPAWKEAKRLMDDGAIGPLRHVLVTWNVENYATRAGIRNWKTSGGDGGGVLGNYVSHSLHYVEWFCGPVSGLTARLSGASGGEAPGRTASLACAFPSGASGTLAVNCAAYLGSGHRLEFYGEDGTLMLVNDTADYMRGFRLGFARRPADRLDWAALEDPADNHPDGRVAPTSRLVQRLIDAVESHMQGDPGFPAGYRVQYLLEAARRANNLGRWIDLPA